MGLAGRYVIGLIRPIGRLIGSDLAAGPALGPLRATKEYRRAGGKVGFNPVKGHSFAER